ncbi:MAG: hypothetical protein COB49_09525 [Alphaproteobacteria bacterium]|nr:MAG: hypothetical protein COB49_09525 [Alphaproteobacteria bacterium]
MIGTLYNKISGEVISQHSVQSVQSMELQLTEDYHAYLWGVVGPDEYVNHNNGDPVVAAKAAVLLIPEKKARINEQINHRYLVKWRSGFNHNGHTYQSDETSMNMIVAAAAQAERRVPQPDEGWMTSNNVWVPMDAVGFSDLATSLHTHTKRLFAIKTAKKAALAALTDLQEILDFDVDGGW